MNNLNRIPQDLHELLDKGDICFVAISNVSLDYAKMNRCLHLQRNSNQREDLLEFVKQLKGIDSLAKQTLFKVFGLYYSIIMFPTIFMI